MLHNLCANPTVVENLFDRYDLAEEEEKQMSVQEERGSNRWETVEMLVGKHRVLKEKRENRKFL